MTKQQQQDLIQNVSDTAIWVAYYRAIEAKRERPLFQDLLAERLIGSKGRQIAESMSQISAHTEYNVRVRTVIIDRFIQRLVSEGVDAVVNLGAGLDTRPYRLGVPPQLAWYEIDQPSLIQLKDHELKAEKPRCQLRRIAADLTSGLARRELFAKLARDHRQILVITEGVLPYLKQDEVAALAADLHEESAFRYWIVDYISPAIYKYFRTSKRMQKMKNAPFVFFPENWEEFFANRGWQREQIQYIPEEGQKLGVRQPIPLIGRLLMPLMSEARKAQFRQSSGYAILRRKD